MKIPPKKPQRFLLNIAAKNPTNPNARKLAAWVTEKTSFRVSFLTRQYITVTIKGIPTRKKGKNIQTEVINRSFSSVV
jgi:hypothetical protein